MEPGKERGPSGQEGTSHPKGPAMCAQALTGAPEPFGTSGDTLALN